MRPDMDRVLIQRPRYGHWMSNHVAHAERRAARAARRDPEALARLPRRGSIKPRRGRYWALKSFSDHLPPLYRFLLSRRGRPWDAVYSELRAHLSPRSYLQQHVYEHLWDMVARHVRIIDGEVHAQQRWGGGYATLRSTWRWPRLYVDPRDGALREAPRAPPPPRRSGPSADHRRRLDDTRWHLRIEGIWYAVDLVELPTSTGRPWGPVAYADAPWDRCLNAVAASENEGAREALYGDRRRVAIGRRQLSRKALRHHGLENTR